VPRTADEQLAAGRAGGVGSFREDVPLVDEVKAGVESDAAGAVESFGWSGGLVLEFEVGMEGGEVERDVGAEIFDDPIGELASLGGIVVQRGNH